MRRMSDEFINGSREFGRIGRKEEDVWWKKNKRKKTLVLLIESTTADRLLSITWDLFVKEVNVIV